MSFVKLERHSYSFTKKKIAIFVFFFAKNYCEILTF